MYIKKRFNLTKFIPIIFLIFSILSAKTVTITGEFEYFYSDKESFVEAKDICLERAKRDAVEKFASAITSISIIRNNMMEKDQIIAITLGVLRNIEYLEKQEERDKNRIYYKITGEIDEDQVLAKLEAKLKEIREITLIEGEVYELIFSFNTEGVYISKDGSAPIINQTKNAVFRISKGNHNFSFIKGGYKELSKEINLTGNAKHEINLEKGKSTQTLKLPSIVRINSNPSGAEIFLNEQKVGVTPLQYNLQPGFYGLKVKKDLYHLVLTDFTVREGETYEIPLFNLKPRFGTLTVNTTPERSKIYINGVFEGYTPLRKEMFLSGNHTIKAESELYHEEIQDFYLADGETKNISLKLKQAFGELTVNSKPEGAKVFIDEQEVGTTPYSNQKMRSKAYRVRLEKPYHSEAVKNVEVKDGQKSTLDFVLDMNVGILNISAQGSEIFLNATKRGEDKIKLNLPPGNYNVTAKRTNHKDAIRTVYVNIGEEQSVNLEPEPRLGSLSIITEPFDSNGAKIYIDHENTGKTTPSVFRYIIGDHTLKLTHPKFLDKEEKFTLREGEERKITVTMITYQGSQQAKKDFWRTQKWIALGSTVALAGSGLFCSSTADGYYDDYMKTGSTDEAINLYDKSTNFDMYKDISYGVSLSSLGYFFYAWYMESRY